LKVCNNHFIEIHQTEINTII